MKMHVGTFNRPFGFTATDLIIVAALIVVLFGLAYAGFRPWGRPITAAPTLCVNHLRQLGLAYRIWSNDHGDRFPMSVSTNEGGALEFAGSGGIFRVFQVISNEVKEIETNALKAMACPSDNKRKPAKDFASLKDANISYFVGLDADEMHPQAILSGDRNISTNGKLLSGILTLPTKNQVRWTTDIHKNRGNLALADCSAMQTSDASLARTITNMIASMTNDMRIAFPKK